MIKACNKFISEYFLHDHWVIYVHQFSSLMSKSAVIGWFSSHRVSNSELWKIFCVVHLLNKHLNLWWPTSLWRSYDVTVMNIHWHNPVLWWPCNSDKCFLSADHKIVSLYRTDYIEFVPMHLKAFWNWKNKMISKYNILYAKTLFS